MFKETLSKFFKVDSLLENLSGYVEARVELLKVEAKEEVARGLAQGIAYAFLAFIFTLVVIFLSIAIALVLGERLGNFAGFSIVSAFYLLVGILLWFSRQKVIGSLENRFVVMFRKKK